MKYIKFSYTTRYKGTDGYTIEALRDNISKKDLNNLANILGRQNATDFVDMLDVTENDPRWIEEIELFCADSAELSCWEEVAEEEYNQYLEIV